MAVVASIAVIVALAACSSDDDPATTGATTSTTATGPAAEAASSCVDTAATATDPRAAEIVGIAESVADELDLAAVVIRVEQGGEEIITTAFGESLRDVPATPADRFWNGAAVFTYLGTVALQLDEEGVLDLDAPIAEHLPDVPSADQITSRMLLGSTSGYEDYVPMASWAADFDADPFRPFTLEELEAYVFAEPLLFEPGTAVSYSHLNFQLIGQVIEGATGQPLDEVLAERILEPLAMERTESLDTADVPSPRLHTFSDERGLYEETSGWSPAWGVPAGAAMITDVCDLARGGRAIGSGELLSDESFATFIDPYPGGLAPPEDCASCIPVLDDLHLGLGVTVAGDWIIQTPLFTGIAGIAAHYPDGDLTIAIANTYAEGGDVSANGSTAIFTALAAALAPEATVPPQL